MELSYRGGLNLDHLSKTISLPNLGRVIGLLLAMESVTGGIKLAIIALTAELSAPFDTWDWLYILVGGVGAFWTGFAGIIEMFALSAASLSEADSQ